MKLVVKILLVATIVFGVDMGVVNGKPRISVVASIGPVHSLVSSVMKGVGAPQLLVKGGASPHTYTLRPSDSMAIQRADLVYWVSEPLEEFLVKPLAALSRKVRKVELSTIPGLNLMPTGQIGARRAGTHGFHSHALHGRAKIFSDMHIWLDSQNAEKMIWAIAKALGTVDPDQASVYMLNARKVQRQIQLLDLDLRARLRAVRNRPYVVFNDAYQYFERRYGLKSVGTVSAGPGRMQGARSILEIRERIRRDGVVCVFSEPQFEPTLVKTLVEGTKARTGILDPLGTDLKPGPELYDRLMRNLGESFLRNLSGNN